MVYGIGQLAAGHHYYHRIDMATKVVVFFLLLHPATHDDQ